MADCEKFTGRLRDLCEGRGRDGRPDPPTHAVVAFHKEQANEAGENPSRNAPTILIRGLNFGRAMFWHLMNGMKTRTQEEIAERLAICQDCEYRTGDGETFNCSMCGCQCSANNDVFLNKLAWPNEVCPAGKWK